MITSKQIVTISEKYLTGKKTSYGYAKVYTNPSSSEIIEIIKPQSVNGRTWPVGKGEIRFIADAKTQNVWAWDSGKALHNDIYKLLGFSYGPSKLDGIAFCSIGSKPVMNGFDKLVFNAYGNSAKIFFTEMFNYNWNWLSQYIDYKERFNSFKQDAERKYGINK
jgi:hypothetical protein